MAAKYTQLAESLRGQLSAIAAQGGRLPTEAELMQRYGVSRQTVRHALSLLREQGLIRSIHGSGSYVISTKERRDPKQIAVVTTFLDDYIFPSILHDVQNVFAQEGYSTLIYATDNSVAAEREILSKLLDSDVSAILIEGSKTALPTPNTDLFMRLRDKGVPMLFLHGTYSNLSGFPAIVDDNYGGGRMLTRYLIDKGHRQIAGIFKSDDKQGLERCHGMVEAMRDAGLPIPDGKICWYDSIQRHGMVNHKHTQLIQNALKQQLSEASAIICYNDEIAHILINCLLEQGRRVPQDVAVVSFDNSYYSQIGPVPISSLGHGSNRIGRLAAGSILRLLRGDAPQCASLDWVLIERQSG